VEKRHVQRYYKTRPPVKKIFQTLRKLTAQISAQREHGPHERKDRNVVHHPKETHPSFNKKKRLSTEEKSPSVPGKGERKGAKLDP